MMEYKHKYKHKHNNKGDNYWILSNENSNTKRKINK